MPYINFHNLTQEQVTKVSKDIIEDFAKLIDRPTEVFYFNGVAGFSIIDNELRDDVCYVKIEWFPRDEATMEKVALMIDDALRKLGIKETVVTFSEFENEKYYKNAKRLK